MPTIFFRIAWMKNYKGVTTDDTPLKGGSDEGKGEIRNFSPLNHKYYGYVWIKCNGALSLENIGAKAGDKWIKGITVVFFATNPESGGQRIVGWYKNATVYKHDQRIRGRGYRAVAAEKDVVFLKENDRIFRIPPKGPGTSHVWYGKNINEKEFNEIHRYLSNRREYEKGLLKNKNSHPWQHDVALKQKIEVEAMKAIEEHYVLNGYKVGYVHKENLGWDLEAVYGTSKLLLEVKGLSGPFNSVELTHNEYSNSERKNYRICIVSNALDKKTRILEIYYCKGKRWIDTNNQELKLIELMSARFTKT